MRTLCCCAKPPSSIGPLIRVFIKCQLNLFPSVLIIKTQGSSCLQKGAKSNEVNSLPGSSGTGAEVGLSCCSYTYPQCTTAWPLYPPLCSIYHVIMSNFLNWCCKMVMCSLTTAKINTTCSHSNGCHSGLNTLPSVWCFSQHLPPHHRHLNVFERLVSCDVCLALLICCYHTIFCPSAHF